jgi:hypothetical protein
VATGNKLIGAIFYILRAVIIFYVHIIPTNCTCGNYNYINSLLCLLQPSSGIKITTKDYVDIGICDSIKPL